ncbi:DUF3352 domain-containing protein [Microcoleus sp. FACHB-672]|uniref:DUF3352 domain-containing protein n=1 Tax=Microcoleus sp. FACHB-672 TaxID=2692825 RepID=UPI001682113D|nr:DUF3352 domain-containing protein [Microcoleus sp. FACHB-672]MBD2040797.1 DUF3352 domain-containing protein [Microcoleus sp. FACHB-672]
MIDKIKTAFEKPNSARLLTVGAAVLLIGGGIAAYWALVQKTPLGNTPVGSTIVPQDAFAAVSLSTNPGQWQQLRQYGTPESRALLDGQLAQWRDNLLSVNGYNYEKDIQPWVGREVMIAWLSPQLVASATSPAPNAAASIENALMIVLPISNAGRAKQLLEKPKPPAQGQWVERTYNNIKIREIQGAQAQRYSAAILDDRFLVVTTNPRATELAIDSYKGGPSLARTPGYREALNQIETSGPFARVYINVPAAADVAAIHSVRTIPPQARAQLQQNQGVATTVNLQPEGINLKAVSWLKPDSEKKQAVENKAQGMLSRLPTDTLMMASGSNLQRMWQDYTEGAEANPLTPFDPQWLQKAITSNTGLNLEKDLLAWMAGEFSFSLIPAAQGTTTQFPAGLVFMVRSSDRRAAENALKQLDRVMSDRYKFKVEEAKIGNQPVVNWTSQFGALTLTHGWLNGNVAFLTMFAPVAGGIVPKPPTPLAASEQFQKAVPTELESTTGNFFIDVDRLVNNKQFFFPELPPAQQAVVNGIRTVGLTAAISNARSTRYDIFMMLKQQGKPGPFPSPSKAIPSPTRISPPKQQIKPSPSPTTLPATPQASPKPSP